MIQHDATTKYLKSITNKVMSLPKIKVMPPDIERRIVTAIKNGISKEAIMREKRITDCQLQKICLKHHIKSNRPKRLHIGF